jgi:acetyl esterase/lipase
MRTCLSILALATLTGLPALAQAPKKAPAPTPGVEAKRNLIYVPDGHERQALDLYVPKSERPVPLVVWIHGGAWQGGNKENPPLMFLTAKGFALASINYRLSQHAVYPAQIHDCKAAIRYLRANAKAHNLDADRIGVSGASAGGHLAALLGTTAGVNELDGTLGKHAGVSSRVQAVFDLFGPTDLSMFGNLDAKSSPGRLVGGALKEKADVVKAANPIAFISKDDPPFLIIHGDKDKTVPINQSEVLHTALQKAGVPSTFIRVPDGGHGGAPFLAPEMIARIETFFRTHLAK